MKTKTSKKSKVVNLKPGEGRVYDMGTMQAIFKADGKETGSKYSVSEWWLDPFSKGPGAHSHEEDDLFYVLEGTMSFLIGKKWTHAKKGSFVLAPGGMKHDFENRTSKRAGALNFSVPGDFEKNMPMIVDWFADHPIGRTNKK
ncbi:MAG: cupin domain-containing protein [Bdellovibrionota bacterium]